MSEASRSGKLVSVRIQPQQAQTYAALMEAVGQTTSDGVRSHIQGLVGAYDALDLAALQIKCEFNWLDTPKANFPELAGDLRVSVSPMLNVGEDDLARLVFTIPEFYVEDYEPFRVDSFYYQRVSNSRISVSSSRTTRNVLSFRLLGGTWKAGIFAYPGENSPWSRDAAEQQIRDAIVQRVSKTVASFVLKCLPDNRLLTQDEVAHANALLTPQVLAGAVV